MRRDAVKAQITRVKGEGMSDTNPFISRLHDRAALGRALAHDGHSKIAELDTELPAQREQRNEDLAGVW